MVDDGKLEKLRTKYRSAIETYGQYVDIDGPFGKPALKIGVQAFSLNHTPDPSSTEEQENAYLEWYKIMLCVALENLVKERIG